MTVRVGIAGAGNMGRTHGRILRADPRVSVEAIYDVDERRRAEAARELGCRAAATEAELFGACDAVYVTVPNTLHAEVAGRAARAGKHVYCEKPFATSLDGARALRDAAGASGKLFTVGHNRRFAPVYRAVHDALAGASPTLAHFKMNRGELQEPPWVGDRSVTGGFLYETPVHLFDLARWLFGEVAEVRAAGRTCVYTEPDNFALLFQFESGVSLTFASCAHATWAFPFERVEIFGRHLTIETLEMEEVRITRSLDAPTHTWDFRSRPREAKWGYAAADHSFVSAILGEAPLEVTAEDGFRSVELVDRVYQLLI